MGRYLVLYHADASAREMMANATPEQAKEGMDAWMKWAGAVGGALVDIGQPLGGGNRVGGSGTSATDGPQGYSVLEAGSLEAATALLDGHPHLMMPGASIDVLEALPIPGM